MQANIEARPGKWRKVAATAGAGAVVGFAGAAAGANFADAGVLGEMSVSAEIALLVAALYLLMGLAVGVGALAPRAGALFLNVEDADELREQRASLIPSAIGCIALAAGLVGLASSTGAGLLPPATALAIFLLLLALTVWLSLRSLRHADELMGAVMRESAAASYYLAFVGIGGWAVLAHLGFVGAPAMLDIVSAFYVLALVGCFWAVGRRGMLVR